MLFGGGLLSDIIIFYAPGNRDMSMVAKLNLPIILMLIFCRWRLIDYWGWVELHLTENIMRKMREFYAIVLFLLSLNITYAF